MDMAKLIEEEVRIKFTDKTIYSNFYELFIPIIKAGAVRKRTL